LPDQPQGEERHEVWIWWLEQPSEFGYRIGMRLEAIIHRADDGGLWAEVPSLAGCVTQAKTLTELNGNLREAIELWLSADDERTESHASDELLELTV
jgi:predicted RNase H-like HicB family nuclease